VSPDASHLDGCTRCARPRPVEPGGEAWLWLRAEGGAEQLLCAACTASPGVPESVLRELRRRSDAHRAPGDRRFSRRVGYRLVPAAGGDR
jgi:hypothetical protein